jgi:tetratricopeptide (TPR) repeat protein
MLMSCITHKNDNLQRIFDRHQQYVLSGQLQLAIDGYNQMLKDYPYEAQVVDNFIRTVENIKTAAENAYKAKNYSHALEVYALLLDNFPNFWSFRNSLSFDQESLKLKQRGCRINICETEVNHEIRTGDYMQALKSYRPLFHEYHNDRSLNQSFSKTVYLIYNKEEKAFNSTDLAAAGYINYALLENYDLIERFIRSLPFSKKSLDEGKKMCRDSLMKMGLDCYRKGDLPGAISNWKGILKFDPENVEIRKAIDNCEEQLKKIKK